ncbi:F0F1 ATP synthase subunit delta [Staphylococcus warneri]|jgi:F-type H+-transporting ATPase subunit delta|uniref:F0F1 ATP synthase subunit delta n=1 Tax=Staphylococcus warneri TaxID=1292 RepID=UPI0005E903F3|nr:F0F1 ATP synthase subunit delta [Staphylococcus warneri]SKR85242.1 F-type ATPase subunit delta [Mycobacteroides abscessus subsp. abscessus]MCM3070647.1 F0F1 ATP synthase subunit delta [Staphylococcus warneri]MCR1797611.1 F0F1 ATP synthase subunit delta [Staphylococcus warneri]MCT2596767.1 F0F1 ATP synthase subunit delta [Staphylococcus warneri]COE42920.1 ATP synthase F0F1 subunit delta [Staphylococcus warneri]
MAKVADKYAKALFDVSADTNQLDNIYEELEVISHPSFDYIKDLKAIDSNPKLTLQKRQSFVENVYGGANQYIVNMLKVLAENRHISYIEDVFKAFQSQYNQHNNQDFALIESTYDLNDDEISKIVELVKEQTNLSKVIVNTKINQDLIGGFRVKVGTTVMDGSVKNDLVQLQRKFKRAN